MSIEAMPGNQENNNETLIKKLEIINNLKTIVESYISNGPNANQKDWDEKDFFLKIGGQLTDEEIRIRKELKQ